MKSIDVLLIGDVHFPQSKLDLDYKDIGIDQDYAKRIATSPLRVVINKVAELAGKTDAILFCGDLTSWGDSEGYEACANWLNDSLQLKKETFWKFDQVHIVPGNHDIDRSACTPFATNQRLKYDPFVNVLRKLGLESLLTLESVRSTHISKGSLQGRLLSLNSCFGCGEFRSLPPGVRDSIFKVLEPFLDSLSTKKSLDEELCRVWEQMDSPSFFGDDIDQLCSIISSLDATEVPIVLAHHNILPQQTTRLDLYTELPNSGAIRYGLAAQTSPVVYAHGHIHRDPIEIVSLPDKNSTPLVCVSAPELRTGFNLLRLVFGAKRTPLGLEVIPYKTSHGNTRCDASPPIRIPFWKPTSLNERCSKDAIEVYSQLRLDGKTVRFAEISNALSGLAMSDAKLESALQELDWIGLVNISNREHEGSDWQIRGVT